MRGLGLEFKSFLLPNLESRVRLEGLNRTCTCLTDAMIGQPLDHNKVAIKHALDYDRRSFAGNFPFKGMRLLLNNEYAFQSFFKTESMLECDWTLKGVLLQSNLRLGWLSKSSPMPERFFVGGPLNMRGFSVFGVGNGSQTG